MMISLGEGAASCSGDPSAATVPEPWDAVDAVHAAQPKEARKESMPKEAAREESFMKGDPKQ
jgi:hypothetical protein